MQAYSLESDADGLVRVLYYLDEEEKAFAGADSPVCKTLKSAMISDSVFKEYADKLGD